jgi:hypothetical protein
MNEYVVPFSILGYLQNGRIERTACLNYSLLQTGKNVMEALEMLIVASGEQTMGIT